MFMYVVIILLLLLLLLLQYYIVLFTKDKQPPVFVGEKERYHIK